MYWNVSLFNTSPKTSHSVQVTHDYIMNLWEFFVYIQWFVIGIANYLQPVAG